MHRDRAPSPLFFLTDRLEFPAVERANHDGLLAVGGDLSVERLLLAYRSGIFPWFNDDSLALWWSPDPRMVLFPDRIHVSKSMRKVMASGRFRLTKNVCFGKVIEHCASIRRPGQRGTWITEKMRKAYMRLYQKGFAVSYEVWEDMQLVGGLYGIDLGHIFCGESMFSKTPNASKFAFITLARELRESGYDLIDCQVYSEHLASLGAEEIPRAEFMRWLHKYNPLA